MRGNIEPAPAKAGGADGTNNMNKALKEKRKNADEALVDEIVQTYIRVFSEARARSARLTDRFGITMQQFATLHVIKNGEDPMYLSDISEKVFLNQSTLTGVIDRMERDGLVQRERSTEDRRKIAIHLTPKGNRLTETIPFSPMEMFRELIRPLARAEKKTLLELLRKISAPLMQSLEEIDKLEKGERKTASGKK